MYVINTINTSTHLLRIHQSAKLHKDNTTTTISQFSDKKLYVFTAQEAR